MMHKKLLLKKLKAYGHSGNEYRVATLYKLYLTTKEITMQSLKSIDISNMPKLTKRAIRSKRKYGRTDPNYRKASLLKTDCC